MRTYIWWGSWVLLIVLTVFATPIYGPVYGQDAETQIAITSPVDGDVLDGVVSIVGTADHASQFSAYQLWFALSGTEQWFPITSTPVQAPVSAGELGQWNTAALPSGQYRLRLRVFLMDGSFSEVLVEDLAIRPVQDAQPSTPSPATEVPPTGIPTILPSPVLPEATAVPTVADSPADTVPVELAGGDPDDEGPSSSIPSAFCTGAVIGVGLFIMMLAYVSLRGRARLAMRQFWAGLDDDSQVDKDSSE